MLKTINRSGHRRAVLDTMLRWTPAQAVMQKRRRDRLAVVTYHAIRNGAAFDDHLDVLSEMGRFVSLGDVVANATDRKPLPTRPILLTFDDGDPSVLHTAAPRLRRRGIPAVMFLITDLIGTDHVVWTTEVEQLVASGGRTSLDPTTNGRALVRKLKGCPDDVRLEVIEELRGTASDGHPAAAQLSTADLAELVRSGVAVSSHTMSHPCLTRCSDDVIDREIAGSREVLTGLLGEPPLALAYPNGDHDGRARRAASRAGYAVAFAFDHRLSPIPPDDPYTIPRLRMNEHATGNRVRTVVSGLHPAIHHLRGRL